MDVRRARKRGIVPRLRRASIVRAAAQQESSIMRSSHFRKLVTLVVLAATLSISASAFADDKKGPGYQESKDESGQVVKFTDDPLGASGLDPNIPMIGLRKPGQRSQLMRPRVNFVTELRRSVEAL
jgi:hypothetical protein